MADRKAKAANRSVKGEADHVKNEAAATAPEERRQQIAERAHSFAAARGFAGGDPVSDWLRAESEVDAQLAAKQPD